MSSTIPHTPCIDVIGVKLVPVCSVYVNLGMIAQLEQVQTGKAKSCPEPYACSRASACCNKPSIGNIRLQAALMTHTCPVVHTCMGMASTAKAHAFCLPQNSHINHNNNTNNSKFLTCMPARARYMWS